MTKKESKDGSFAKTFSGKPSAVQAFGTAVEALLKTKFITWNRLKRRFGLSKDETGLLCIFEIEDTKAATVLLERLIKSSTKLVTAETKHYDRFLAEIGKTRGIAASDKKGLEPYETINDDLFWRWQDELAKPGGAICWVFCLLDIKRVIGCTQRIYLGVVGDCFQVSEFDDVWTAWKDVIARMQLPRVIDYAPELAVTQATACRHCGAQDKPLKRCAACKSAAYCSRECQVADYRPKHKVLCVAEGKLASVVATVIDD